MCHQDHIANNIGESIFRANVSLVIPNTIEMDPQQPIRLTPTARPRPGHYIDVLDSSNIVEAVYLARAQLRTGITRALRTNTEVARSPPPSAINSSNSAVPEIPRRHSSTTSARFPFRPRAIPGISIPRQSLDGQHPVVPSYTEGGLPRLPTATVNAPFPFRYKPRQSTASSSEPVVGLLTKASVDAPFPFRYNPSRTPTFSSNPFSEGAPFTDLSDARKVNIEERKGAVKGLFQAMREKVGMPEKKALSSALQEEREIYATAVDVKDYRGSIETLLHACGGRPGKK